MAIIHPSAVVEEGAVLAEDAIIGPHCYVGSEVVIGSKTTLFHGASIHGKTTIGAENRIFSHAVIGSIPQDLKFHGEESRLEIGDRNTIREFTLLNSGTEGGGHLTKLGNDNLLMGYVHVAHDCIIGDRCILANGATLAGHVELGHGVVIGGLTPVHQFVKIGDLAMIAGASALSQDVPPYCLAEGNRAVLRGLNLTGLRRHLESREEVDHLKTAYRMLFESGQPLKENAQILFDTTTSKHVKALCRFVIATTRGIPYERKGEE